jgi:hypothetical protein
MICKLDKPTDCFNCPYPDCKDQSCSTTPEEVEALRKSGLVYGRSMEEDERKRNS